MNIAVLDAGTLGADLDLSPLAAVGEVRDRGRVDPVDGPAGRRIREIVAPPLLAGLVLLPSDVSADRVELQRHLCLFAAATQAAASGNRGSGAGCTGIPVH